MLGYCVCNEQWKCSYCIDNYFTLYGLNYMTIQMIIDNKYLQI